MSPLRVTVAICTWNRCQRLRLTLEAMAALEVPPDVWWEILVIDNGSDDATGEVIASYAGRVPLRSVRETAPGLSNARNRAVAEAGGAYIIWTDDDVLVDEGWLAAYCRAFRRWPDADIFGGPIEPLFEGTPPAWIARVLEQIGPVYGRQTLGEQPVRLQPDKVGAGPYGGNMALTRTALLGFPFDPQLGVQRGEYGIGEETEVIKRMLLAGLDGWWTPEPKVRHVIPRASQNVSYVRRWMVGSGRYIAAVLERDCRGWRNHPVRLCVRIIRHELLLLLRRPLSSPEVWIRHVIQAGRDRGRLHGRLRMRRAGSA